VSAVSRKSVEAVSFDSSVFDLDTVKRAIYRFSAQFAADISLDGALIVCRLSFNSPISDEAARKLVDELKREVLDQDLRRRIAEETAPIRNAILALAFTNPKLKGDE
jgi:His-Xaa-Ser system protein HxsD